MREIAQPLPPRSSVTNRAAPRMSSGTVAAARSSASTSSTRRRSPSTGADLRGLLREPGGVDVLRVDQDLDACLLRLAERILVLAQIFLRQLVDLRVGPGLRQLRL